MLSKLKYILFLILLIIALYFYIYNRKAGCKNKKAINYNPTADISDEMMCRYDLLGCMDKNAINYNLYASTSCTEDCVGCLEKGTCDLCKSQRVCKDSCPECICKIKVKGCNREWALNYNPNATDDNNTCIGPDDILKKISIVSGGDCNRCSSRVAIKVGDKYPVLGGKQGINLLVIERNKDLKIRYNRSFMTGNYESENKKFVDFMRKYVFYRDIVIIAVRGDAVGYKRSYNSKKELVFIESILSDDSKMVLRMLGARNPNLARNGSYILVGSYLKDIFFETYSSNADSFFPYFNLTNYGCINFNHPKFEKIELDISKLKLLQMTGDITDLDIFNNKSDETKQFQLNEDNQFGLKKKLKFDNYVDMNRSDNINRCALEVIQMGYRNFSVSKTKCYIYKIKDGYKEEFKKDKINNVNDYFLKNKFYSYKDKDNKYIRLSDNVCRLNNQLLSYGNNLEESFYLIDDIYYSNIYSMFYGGKLVELYSLKEFKGIRRDIGVGIHEAWGIIPKSVNSTKDIDYLPIQSAKIPLDFRVTLFRNVKENEDLVLYKKYNLVINDDKKEFLNLDFSCGEGCLLIARSSKNRQLIYRTWQNIIKDIFFKRNEVFAKLFILETPIEEVNIIPEMNTNYVEIDNFNISTYEEIERIKDIEFFNKVGYIETYNYNNKKLRRIKFSSWEYFWKTKNLKADELNIILYVVDPNKVIMKKSTVLESYSTYKPSPPEGMLTKEATLGFTHKECVNIPKFGGCDNRVSSEGKFSHDIKYIIVSKYTFGVTFFENPRMKGMSFTLSYGNYNIPDDLCMIIRSLNIKMWGIVITLYLDYNFKNEYIKIRHHDIDKRDIYKYNDLNKYIPNNKKIRSISISNLSYNTIISNNPYPETYDSNIKYNNYEYPFKISIPNSDINNLDYCYDYFKDDIILESNDKKIEIIKAKYNFKKQLNKLIIDKDKVYYINSGGSIVNLKKKMSDNVNILESGIVMLKTYESSNAILPLREIFIINGKYYKKINNKVKLLPLTDISFSIKEKQVKLYQLKVEDKEKFKNIYNNIKIIINYINSDGKEIRLFDEENNKYDKINIEDINYDIFTERKINLYLRNKNSNEIILENINKVDNSFEDYNIYIIKRFDIIVQKKKGPTTVNENLCKYLTTNYYYEIKTKILKIKPSGTFKLSAKFKTVDTEPHGLNVGSMFQIEGVFGIMGLSNRYFKVNKIINNFEFEIEYVEGIYWETYISGGNIFQLKNDGYKFDIYQKMEFKNAKNIITLPEVKKKISQLNIIEKDNYSLINNLKVNNDYNKYKIEGQTIILIKDDFDKINKMIYFCANRYVINNNINNLNNLNKTKNDNHKYNNLKKTKLNNDIKISKFEKKAKIFQVQNYSKDYNNRLRYNTSFNNRNFFNKLISGSYINNIINNINNFYLKKSGYFETYDLYDNLIYSRVFYNGKIILNNKILNDFTDIVFTPKENKIIFYNKNKEKISAFPFMTKINYKKKNPWDAGYVELFNHLTKKNNCIIKLYDINMKLLKVILFKDNKYIMKENGKLLNLDYSKYLGRFNKFNWDLGLNNFLVDIDEYYYSIETENGYEILYNRIYNPKNILSLDELIRSNTQFVPPLEDYIMRLDFKQAYQYSIIRLYDANNKITKKIKICMSPYIGMYSAYKNKEPLILFDNSLKYIESYDNNINYNCFDKDNLIFTIKIPTGMRGIYTYMINKKKVYVNKVLLDSKNKNLIKLYDENNNLIMESEDRTIHNYIFDTEFGLYNGEYLIEYYPKDNKRIFRLFDINVNVNRITIDRNKSEYEDIQINDQIGNIIKTVSNKNSYIIDNYWNYIKLSYPDKSYKLIFTEESINVTF